MSISILLLGASALAGAAGVGGIAKGGSQVLKANSTMKELQVQHQQNLARLEKRNKECVRDMDKHGRKELEILKSFQEFSTVFEKIKNRPEFAKIQKQIAAFLHPLPKADTVTPFASAHPYTYR